MNENKDILHVKLEELWPVMKEQIDAGGKVRFGPKGVSMMPMLRQGVDSVVIAAAPDKLKKYDIPLYRRPDGHFVLHRIVGIKNGRYVMCGDNQTSYEYNVPRDWILAVVTGFYRDKQYVDINDSNYIKYYKKRVFEQRLKHYKIFLKNGVKKILRYKK